MEKVVKLAFVFVLCGILGAAVFGENKDAAETTKSEGQTSAPAADSLTETSITPQGNTTEATTSQGGTGGNSQNRNTGSSTGTQGTGGRPGNSGTNNGGNASQQSYTVTFNTDGGSDISPIQVEKNSSLGGQFPVPPEKKGFVFEKWLDGRSEFNKDTKVTRNMTVTAQWERQEYTVTFDVDGGKPVDSQKVAYEDTLEGKLPASEKDGFQFGGWFIDPKDDNTKFDENTKVTESRTLLAKWIPNYTTGILLKIQEGLNRLKEQPVKYSLWDLLSAGAVALVLIVLAAFNAITVQDMRKKVNGKFADLGKEQKKQNDAVNTIIEKIGAGTSLSDRTWIASSADTTQIERLQEELEREKRQNLNYRSRINTLEAELQKLKEENPLPRPAAGGRFINVIDAFNNWAAHPFGPLPQTLFYYIDEDVKRTKCEIKTKESERETNWISNRQGTKKYLFPNPNSFNQMTDILLVYKMDPAKLKAKGQNKIKIITPVEIVKGFIEFPGELELL